MAAFQKHIFRVKQVFDQYNIPNDTHSLCLCEYNIFAINFAKRRRKSPGLQMLKNVMGFNVVAETRMSIIGNY